MGDTFDSKGGEQNIAQGKNAIGKQVNITQPVSGDGNIFSATGNVTVNQGLRVKPRTVLLGAGLGAALLGTGLAGWYWLAPPPVPTNTISINGNNSGTAIVAGGNVAVTYGMSPEDAGKLAEKLLAPLQGQLEAKDQQIKALTDAITALSKTGAPAASINDALQALEQGNTAKAQAIFAEVLKTKEAEGRQATKEAAEAARHLGALAYLHDTKAALAAYQKAVELDPDNADGWNWLGHLLRRTGELAQAEAAYRKVLALGEAHQDKEEQAMAFGNIGIVYDIRGDLDKAEEMHSKALALNEALGRKKGIAAAYGNLGIVYRTRGDLDKAGEMHRKALALNEALGSKEGMAQALGNLGIVHWTRGDLDKAEEMYKKSLEISEALGLKEATANQYGNLGIVHQTRGDLDKAGEMYRKSLAISEALGLKEVTASLYGNLGIVHKTRGDLDKAEEMYSKALALDEALGRKEGMAAKYANLGSVHEQRGDLDKAEAAWKKSLSLYQEMGHPNAKMVQQGLDDLARQKGSSR